MSPFPDGSGAGDFEPYAGTFSTGHAVNEVSTITSGASVPVGSAPVSTSMFPPGMATAPMGNSGLPAWVSNPGAFVPPPDARTEDGGMPPILLSRAAPASYEPPELSALMLSAATATAPDLVLAAGMVKCPKCNEMNPPGTKVCKHCGAKIETKAKADLSADNRRVILYQTGVPLNLSATADDTGLIWKVACKTGTLALSPGPGQIDMETPLELTPKLFDDMLRAYDEKAFPYVTVPETHSNGALENTGYVKAMQKLTKAELLADGRIQQEGKDHIAGDPDETEYLLTGIGFTKEQALLAAQEGSIPDVSIGVKFGYRNKRSGTKYDAAMEHLALTPVPWVDGNIPFNAAAALGVQPFDQDEPDEPFAVYTELNASMSVRVSGDTYDATATRAALMALNPGDELSWNYDVNVTRLESDSDGTFFLVRAPESDNIDNYDYDRTPKLYSDIDSTMSAVTQGVAVCQQRKANQMARDAAIRASMGNDQPSVAKYSADGPVDLALADLTTAGRKAAAKSGNALPDGSFPINNVEDLKNAIQAIGRAKDEDAAKAHVKKRAKELKAESELPDSWDLSAEGEPVDLALAVFDESKHPRLHGRFAKGLQHLDFKPAPVATRHTPGHEAGTEIADAGKGIHVVKHPSGGHTVWRPVGKNAGMTQAAMLGPDGQYKSNGAPASKADAAALEHVASHAPDGDNKTAKPAGTPTSENLKRLAAQAATTAHENPTPENVEKATRAADAHAAASTKTATASRPENQIARLQKQLTDMPQGNENRTPEQQAQAAQIRKKIQTLRAGLTKLGQDPGTDASDTLSLSGEPGLLENVNHDPDEGMPEPIPTSVEELLARQQAEIEQLNATVAQQATDLSLAQGTMASQGEQLHVDNVNKVISQLSGRYTPGMLLAVRQVMLQDKPWERQAEGGLNLSVSAPKADGTAEVKELKSPTDICSFLLSAMPTIEGGNAALTLANINAGLDSLTLSAHDAANGSMDSREAEARKAVDEWQREHKPELFNPDGSRKGS